MGSMTTETTETATIRQRLAKWAGDNLIEGQIFHNADAVKFFGENYPECKPSSVATYVGALATNNQGRLHFNALKPNDGWDLFFKVERGAYRLYVEGTDPEPIYNSSPNENSEFTIVEDTREEVVAEHAFALEAHLRDYLARNLQTIEAGLNLYQDNGRKGVEFPAGKRQIDILAEDADGFVVIELKVSKGHERTMGQLLGYMGWVHENLANGKSVRGIIVAEAISEDLRIAQKMVPNVQLREYSLTCTTSRVA